MSYRPHLTKNKLYDLPDEHGQLFWQIEYWPEGRKRINGKLTGKRLTRVFFGTEAGAQVQDAALNGKPAAQLSADKRHTVASVMAAFLEYYRLEVAPGTLADFNVSMLKIIPHFGNVYLNDINNALVQSYKNLRLSQSYRGNPIKRRTINKELAYLSSIIKWAQRETPPLCESHVRIIPFPKKQTAAPLQQTHSVEEVQAIRAEIGRPRRTGCQQHASDVQQLTTLMYDAGLRVTEACKLVKEKVNLPAEPVKLNAITYYGTITVIRKGGKEQLLPILTHRLYLQLKERMKQVKSGYLYVNPITRTHYKNIRAGLKSAAKRAGIDKRVTHHLLRHDYVTHLWGEGADLKAIQGLAGHADLQTTMDIYTQLEESTMRAKASGFTTMINNLPVRNSSE